MVTYGSLPELLPLPSGITVWGPGWCRRMIPLPIEAIRVTFSLYFHFDKSKLSHPKRARNHKWAETENAADEAAFSFRTYSVHLLHFDHFKCSLFIAGFDSQKIHTVGQMTQVKLLLMVISQRNKTALQQTPPPGIQQLYAYRFATCF